VGFAANHRPSLRGRRPNRVSRLATLTQNSRPKPGRHGAIPPTAKDPGFLAPHPEVP
jgi:hypothetical protein